MADDNDTVAKADWAGDQGERWLANVDRLEAMLAPIGDALLHRAKYQEGERVIDIGCGGGASTRSIAKAITPGGDALGVDICEELVNHAAALSLDKTNLQYRSADAASFELLSEPYDRLHSRFGSMFFDDPFTAFGNLRSLLKPSARIDLAVWAHPRDNPWMMEMMGVARAHAQVPPAQPRAPGPFAFEDLDYLSDVLTSGGFTQIEAHAYTGQQAIGGAQTAPKDATQFVLASFGVGQIIAQLDDVARKAATSDMEAMFERHFTPGAGVMLGCKAWLVSARAAK